MHSSTIHSRLEYVHWLKNNSGSGYGNYNGSRSNRATVTPDRVPWQPTYRHGVDLADRKLCGGLGVVPVSDWRLKEIEELVQQVEVLPRHVRDLEYGA
jgi:hypothetical protein